MEVYDLAIIGAGPAGLAAGIYASERKLKTVIFESNTTGGQLISLYPDKNIYDYPGFIKITGRQLAEQMRTQVLEFGCLINEDVAINNIKKDKQQFILDEGQNKYTAKSILLATGVGDYVPCRLGVSGEDKLENKGINYTRLPNQVTHKRIMIVGGGDTALENAVAAAEKGAYVTLVHRNEKFRALEKTVIKAKSLGVQFYLSSHLSKINGDEFLENVEIENLKGHKKHISTDYLVICIGSQLNKNFVTNLGLVIKQQAIVVDENMQTSIKGMFACGDIIIPVGKYKRITVAVGTAAQAINGIYQYLKNPYWENKI